MNTHKGIEKNILKGKYIIPLFFKNRSIVYYSNINGDTIQLTCEHFSRRRAQYTVRNVETKPALFKRDFTHGCTRKFTIHIYIYNNNNNLNNNISLGKHILQAHVHIENI